MKKMILAALLVSVGLMSGCSMFDLNGDGKFDPVTYLEEADISVGWVDEDGTVYTMALDELGHKIAGEFIQAKTGYTYKLDPEGGITLIDPDGKMVTVSPKAVSDE